MTTGKYILGDDDQPIEEPDLIKWAAWFENSTRRIVGRDRLHGKTVSTVFLGIDLNILFRPRAKPQLWETIIFDADGEAGYQQRYTSLEAAKQGHAEALKKAAAGMNPQ